MRKNTLKTQKKETKATWRRRLYEIIYEADTPEGKWFDIILLWVIILSILVVMLESVTEIHDSYGALLNITEWVITILFTIEFAVRIISTDKPLKYIFSFYGIVDFLSTVPKYLSLLFAGSHLLISVRALRLLRVFRILKLVRYTGEGINLARAIRAGWPKISVFLLAVLSLSVILGTVMYLIEGPENGFTSIPRSLYWTIVTLTTVGYGDIAPNTPWGQAIAAVVMILGYGIIAVPTGIVSTEYIAVRRQSAVLNMRSCENCGAKNHRDDAGFCYRCGVPLKKPNSDVV